MLIAIIRNIVKCLLWLRYDIRVTGLDAVARRGMHSILFLPSHPALIDPIIVVATLNKGFNARALADEDTINRPVIRWLASLAGVRTIPDAAKIGGGARAGIALALAESAVGLEFGENSIIYPAGNILRSNQEELGANSAVETLLRQAPHVRVVLLRTRGLWGSSSSTVNGYPNVGNILLRALRAILANFLFFTPRRRVTLEFVEPDDFPRDADRNTINRYLEAFYNTEPLPCNTYVPYTIWERQGVRVLPEPERGHVAGDAQQVPAATREIVTGFLKQLSGADAVRDDQSLTLDLGLDSLARAELLAWLVQEFGVQMENVDALATVADVLLTAAGEAVRSAGKLLLPPAPARWFAPLGRARLQLPAGDNIAELFLAQARRHPRQVIVADAVSGARTYRDLLTAVLALLPQVRRLPGASLGIMLPASVAADVAYLVAMYSGKRPVMVNWTVGSRNILHGLEVTGVQHVLTARKLVTTLEMQGTDLRAMKERLLFIEQMAGNITRGEKLRAWLGARLGVRALRRASVSSVAAVLFTSGSESLPKAVPLTHANLLADIRAALEVVTVHEDDSLLGMLPPFHSFGLTVNIVLALCARLRTSFHPNPTEGALLARLIADYKLSIMVGTPTFLAGIARAATREQLASLRLAVVGAEECPPRVYALLNERCPQATVLEGYGITECSPIVALNDESDPRPGAIGKLLTGFEHVLIDPKSGQRVPPGQTGLLLLRGPSVFAGYLANAPSPFVEFDGKPWYRTGDLVCEDAGGVFTFKGRLKRFVKIGGEMISLPAIESVLLEHLATPKDEGPILAVSATASEERPELVLFTTRSTDRDTINRYLRDDGLSPLHRIRRVIQLDAIPVLGTGKTDYQALQRRL